MYIEWCKCQRAILKSCQMKINDGSGKCDYCEKEHADSLKDRILGEEDKDAKQSNG